MPDSSLAKLGLIPEFQEKIEDLIARCAKQDLVIVPYFGFRTLDVQNRLWRQSRNTFVINAQEDMLRGAKAVYLASALARVGPQPRGLQVTNTIGGLSWHNWGEAVDIHTLDANGKINHSGTHASYVLMGSVCAEIGLKWGGSFTSFPDYGHVQLREHEVTRYLSLHEISQHFESVESISNDSINQ